MKSTNTASALNICMRTAVFLFVFFILSYTAHKECPSCSIPSDNTLVIKRSNNNLTEVIQQNNLLHNADLMVRGKFKTKLLFKKFISIQQTGTSTYAASDAIPSFSSKLFSVRPAYYGFLFRFTPF